MRILRKCTKCTYNGVVMLVPLYVSYP